MSRNSVPAGTPHLGEIEQQVPRLSQSLIYLEGLIEVRVINQGPSSPWSCAASQSRPASRGRARARTRASPLSAARHTHAPASVSWIEHGPDDDHQPVVSAGKNVADLSPRLKNSGGSALRNRQLFFKKDRGKDNFGPLYAKVVCGIKHSSHFTGIIVPGDCVQKAWFPAHWLIYQPFALYDGATGTSRHLSPQHPSEFNKNRRKLIV